MAIFPDRLVDWITRYWGEMTGSNPKDKRPHSLSKGKSAQSDLRTIEIWIYRIFGILFAAAALVVAIIALTKIL